jgi:hypothetical protein
MTPEKAFELLKWIHELSRQALFEKSHRAAATAALKALSEINKRTAQYM